MRAGAPDKVVYEAAAACLPVLASNPIFDELLAPEQRFTRWDPGPSPIESDARRDEPWRREPHSGTRFASVSRRVTRSNRGPVASSTPRECMTDGVVLHTQKVAGISGSEAHLLQLLPDLRERGWDVRFLMLHEDEPGAWEFAARFAARGVPLDDIRLRADVDPIAFGEVSAYLMRVRPQILRTSCTPTSTGSSPAR